MSTTKMAATLYQLQQLDLELERLIAEQQALESSLQGDSVLKRLQAEHTIAQQELLANREQFVRNIDADLLKRYEALKRTKQGRAVSKVDQNSCQWCRVILTPSELQRVRVNTDLQMCSNCGRILYYDR